MFNNLFGKKDNQSRRDATQPHPLLELARRVQIGQMSLAQAQKEIVSDKNMERVSEITIMSVLDMFRQTKDVPDPNQRIFNFLCMSLTWEVANKINTALKADCANAVGESVLAYPSPSDEMLEYGVRMLKIAEGLNLRAGNTEMAGRILVNAAIALMGLSQNKNLPVDKRSLWIEAALYELESARNFVKDTADPTIMGRVLMLSAMAYKERIKGDSKSNAQKEIEFLTQAQTKFSPQSNPAQWAEIQRQMQDARRRALV